VQIGCYPEDVPDPVRVRPATVADAPAFLALVDGLADYERLPRPDAEARQRLIADAFGPQPRFHLLLAELDGAVVGYAVWFPTYSTFLARPTLYLEDVFVAPEARGRGAGKALFRACAAEAVRWGCGRMDWAVLEWNRPSIEFYEAHGARHMSDWLPFRLDGDSLLRAARGEVSTEPARVQNVP
jgi:GNAT superfamily N-acetyltransferase